DEVDETFAVNLSSATGATISDATGIGTIRDEDPDGGTATLAVGDVVVAEGNGGTSTAVFTVRLSAAAANTVTVDYATVDDTAAAPRDYTAKSGLLSFSPGQTFKTVPVTVKGDVVDEVDETFAVNLSSPTGATISDATGIGTIRDDD